MNPKIYDQKKFKTKNLPVVASQRINLKLDEHFRVKNVN